MKKKITLFVLLFVALLTTQAQNNALSFDGNNDYVTLPTNPALDFAGSSSLTVTAWVNPTGATTPIYTKRANNSGDLQINFSAGSKLLLGFDQYNVNGWQNMSSSAVIPRNQWTHVAFTLEGGVVKIYINGVFDSSITLDADRANTTASTGTTSIGGYGLLSDNGLQKLDEVSIWNKALSESEIAGCMTNAIAAPTSEANLVAYYKFNQGTAYGDNSSVSSVVDASSLNLDGSFNNFSLSGGTSNFVGYVAGAQTVSTISASNVSHYTADVTSEITVLGSDAIVERGVCFRSNDYPTVNDGHFSETGVFAKGQYSIHLTGLSSNSSFKARAYIISSVGEVTYGDTIGIKTLSTDYYPTGSMVGQTWDYNTVVAENDGKYYNSTTGKWGCVIDDASLVGATYSIGDAYDGAFEFFIGVSDSVYTEGGSGYINNNNNPLIVINAAPALKSANTATLDTVGTTIYLPEQLIDGLYVSKSYFFSTTEPVVRTLYKVRNPSTDPISTVVGTYTNMGSDSETVLAGSSTGEATLSDADRWMISTDSIGYDNGGDPINTWVRFGPGAVNSTPLFGMKPEKGSEDYQDTIPVTVPANDYVLVMQFNRLDSTVVSAQNHATTFDTADGINNAGYLTGLSAEDVLKVANWDLSAIIVPTKLATEHTSNAISIYPNPATEGFTVEAGNTASLLTISNIVGNIVLSEQVSGNAYINISNLPKGTYIVMVGGKLTKLIKK